LALLFKTAAWAQWALVFALPVGKEKHGIITFTLWLLRQNRRQKIFNRGALQFCGGLCACAAGA